MYCAVRFSLSQSELTELSPLTVGECPNFISVCENEIRLSCPNTYLVYYYGTSECPDADAALVLNRRDIPATHDSGSRLCGGAVLFLSDSGSRAHLSLRGSGSIRGYIVISQIRS